MKDAEVKKFLITGGHLSPALSLLEFLLLQKQQVVFVGRRSAFSEQKDLSLEFRLLGHRADITFYTLETGRFTRTLSLGLVRELFKMIGGVGRSISILRKERPYIVMSFGGYLSLPVCLAAFSLGIPVYLHEQTIAPGLANKLIGFVAKKVFVTFPETAGHFPRTKTRAIGMPLRRELSVQTKPGWFKESGKPLILILGGSSGSHSINILVEKTLPQLLQDFQVIHQTGDNAYGDFERLSKQKDPSYTPVDFITPEHMAYLYRKAELVVSRIGANTFFELIHFGKPAVLVPLPWSAGNEQLKHARILETARTAKVFLQGQPTEKFYSIINSAYRERKTLTNNYEHLQRYRQLIVSPQEIYRGLSVELV